MALVTSLGGTHNTSLNQDTYATTSFSAAVGDVLVVPANYSDSLTSTPAPTLSSGAASWTKHEERLPQGATAFSLVLWTGRVTTAISSGTVTLDVTGDTGSGCGMGAFVVTGRGIFRQFKFATFTAGNTPTFTMDAALLNTSAYIGAIWNASNPATITQPSSWTEDSDVGHLLPTMGMHLSHRDGGEGGNTTITYGSTSATGGFGWIVEIAQSGGPLVHNGPLVKGALVRGGRLVGGMARSLVRPNVIRPSFAEARRDWRLAA